MIPRAHTRLKSFAWAFAIFLLCQSPLVHGQRRAIAHSRSHTTSSAGSLHAAMQGFSVSSGGGKAGGLKVVIVNDIPGHLEVLASILHMFKQAGVKPTTLYTGNQQLFNNMEFFSWFGFSDAKLNLTVSTSSNPNRPGPYAFAVPSLGFFRHMPPIAQFRMPPKARADLVVCISPELARGVCSHVLAGLKPAFLVTFVHRAEQITSQVYSMYPRQTMVALSPHVANAVEEVTGISVDWTLPVAPYVNKTDPCDSLACLDGFVMQGSIRAATSQVVGSSGFTRDYTTLWRRLMQLQRVNGKVIPKVNVTVLGRGDPDLLQVPASLATSVTHYSNIPYPEFWSRIARSLALLPCFGTEAYYTTRLSSTITASLITTTPLIADRRLLSTYTFLSEEHVFLQQEGEDEAATMMRVAKMSEKEVLSRRQALARLRDALNLRSQVILKKWLSITRALSSPDENVRQQAGYMLQDLQAAAARRAALRRARQTLRSVAHLGRALSTAAANTARALQEGEHHDSLLVAAAQRRQDSGRSLP